MGGDSDRRSGFTLIELVVSAALMAVMVGGMLGVVGVMLEHWRRTADTVERATQAEAALDLLEQDLGGVLMQDERAPLMVSVEANADDPRRKDMSLRFHTASAGALTGAGAVREVTWYTAVDTESSPFVDDTIPSLFRAAIDPAETWRRLRLGDRSSIRDSLVNRNDGFLLARCLSMNVEVWVEARDGTLTSLNGEGRLQAPGDIIRIPTTGLSQWKLAYLDVSVRVLSTQGADLLRRHRAGLGEITRFDGADWIEAHSEVIQRRILLPGSR